jgi:hypothetical protein
MALAGVASAPGPKRNTRAGSTNGGAEVDATGRGSGGT